jgi:alpha-soluble NSF attachment protein
MYSAAAAEKLEQALNISKTTTEVVKLTKDQLENSANLCLESGHLYKMDKNWNLAAEAYGKAADYFVECADKVAAAQYYVVSSDCLSNLETYHNDTDQLLSLAVQLYSETGAFSMAAKTLVKLAKVHANNKFADLAILTYLRAASIYETEGSLATANSQFIEASNLMIMNGKYLEAANILTKVTDRALTNNLLKWGAKNYVLLAILCYLAADDGTKAFETYYTFDVSPNSNSRELTLAKSILDAISLQDPNIFTEAVKDYDNITKLDQMHTKLLLAVKATLLNSLNLSQAQVSQD